MRSLLQTLTPRESVFDKSYRDVVLDLTDLADNKIDPDRFFAENHITKGMEQLYTAVFRRMEGSSDDGVFKLTQSMGGGKTHNLIAIGLLAQNPSLREPVMGTVYKTTFRRTAQVVAFSGRQYPKHGIWGYVAEQLSKTDVFRHLTEKGEAPDQADWIRLLKGDPVLILLDELPDYLKYATTIQAGLGSLADKTARALTTLLTAVNKAELSNVAVVISDLQGAYAKGSTIIDEVIADFEKETLRSAKNFTPVQQNSNEIYHILHKRLFVEKPDPEMAKQVAGAYCVALENAVKMDLTNESPQKLEAAIQESYPFHPSLRELYARFKENPGFMQTRGLIRLMRTVVARMYDKEFGWANRTLLIHPYDIDPNDSDTHTELNNINNKLTNAISNDIASQGQAAAEKLADELGNDLPLKTAKLLFMSSLNLVQGGAKGLKLQELFAFLSAPGSEISTLNASVLPLLRERSWYLHTDKNGSLLYKDVKNVSAQINAYRQTYNPEAIRKEIKTLLEKLFEPQIRDVYQKLYVLPAVDEIEEERSKIALVIYQPYQSGMIHPDLQAKYGNTRYKNRLLFLTGDHQSMDAIFENARSIRAAQDVIKEFEREKTATNDPQFLEAGELLDQYRSRFFMAVTNVFTKLFYPTKMGLLDANIALRFERNEYNGEDQIRKTLADKRKFESNTSSDAFVLQLETKLFGGQKKKPWSDILEAAATDPSWLWHKPNALEQLLEIQKQKDLWRLEGNWVHSGPFPKPPTSVQVQVIEVNTETGKSRLKITPIRGNVVHYDYGTKVSVNSPIWDTHEHLSTDEMQVSFLCVDNKNVHETGDPLVWQNTIFLKYDFVQQGQEYLVTLRAIPRNAEVKYTTDGSDPLKFGAVYSGPFLAKPQCKVLAAGAKNAFLSDRLEFDIPKLNATGIDIDKQKPLAYKLQLKRETTSETYQLIGLLMRSGAQVAGLSLASHGQHWANLQTAAALRYPAGHLETMTRFLQDHLYGEGEISLLIQSSYFPSGQAFLDFAREASIQYKPQDIEQ